MTRIFLAHTPASAASAEELHQELQAKGYTLLAEPSNGSALARESSERALIGSAAVVLFWEQSAAAAVWQERHIHLPLRFQKPLFPLRLDATPLPDSIAALPTLSGQLPAPSTLVALLSLPDFPPAHTNDALHLLYEEATGEIVHRRRAAIEKTAALLASQEQNRDVLLRLLTYLAEHDQIGTLRQEASKVLLADARQRVSAPPFSPLEAAMMIAGQCERGHLSYYNRRLICQQYREIAHAPRVEQSQRDELLVSCQTCCLPVVVYVDCGAYQ